MMKENGLVKLSEECAEVIQVSQKMIAYPECQFSLTKHPDGTVLRERLIEEMGDALAAMEFVANKLQLSTMLIGQRKVFKAKLYKEWDSS